MEPRENDETAMPTTDPLATRKAAAALEMIQDAQRQLDRAAQALSAVNGLAVECRRLAPLYDQVHRVWYVVRDKADEVRRRGGLTLDHLPDPCEARWTRGRS